jgi:hypothetical protein
VILDGLEVGDVSGRAATSSPRPDALRAVEPKRAQQPFSSAADVLSGYADEELKLETGVLYDRRSGPSTTTSRAPRS